MWSGAVFGVEFQRETGSAPLAAQRFRGMLLKHVIHSWRNPIDTIGQLLFPFILTIIACLSMLALPSKADPPPLPLNLSYFDNSKVLFARVGTGLVVSSLAYSYSEIANRHAQAVSVKSIDDSLLDAAESDPGGFNRRYIVAGTARSSRNNILIGHFNNFALHSIAISLSLVDNALLLYAIPGNPPIVTINHPLPRSASSRASEIQMSSQAAIIFSLDVIVGLTFLVGIFVVFVVNERSNKSKHCQLITGVNAMIYWLSAVIWGLVIIAVSSFLTIILVLMFQLESYSAWPVCR